MTTTAVALTKTLVEAWSSDMAITKREKVDMERLDFLRTNPDVPAKIKGILSAWGKLVKEGCWAEVLYVLGKNAKFSDDALGRLNAKNGIGLQSFPRDIRNALAQRVYWDIDIASAHPTLCRELCNRYTLPTVYQDEFIANKSEKMNEIMEVKDCNKDSAKITITSLYFGDEYAYTSLPEFYKNLWKEIDIARKVITQDEEWTESLKFLNGKKKNRLGSAFSFILQSIERACLLSMERSAKKNGRSLDTYIHDGGLIRKREGEEEFPDALLRTFEADILKDVGFNVTLASKPMETSFTFAINENTEYLEKKHKFENEENVFSVKHPAMWCRVFENQLKMLDTAELTKNYETWTVGEDKFLSMWRADPTRREYEEFVFLPNMIAPSNKFNLFMGYAVEPKRNDELVGRWLECVSLACGKQQKSIEYVLNWSAHLIQVPNDKIGVAIVCKGLKGSGKDSSFNALGNVLGRKMFYNTGTPDKSVFSKFNSMMKTNLLTKFEEATYGNGKEYEDMLKYFITSPTLDIQEKGKDQFNAPNFSRFVFTTNHDIPVVVSDDERRYFFTQTSPDRIGDRAFWNETYSIFAREEFNQALLYYLLNRDISQFEPRNYPETEYGKSVKQAFIPTHAQYFQSWIERCDDGEVKQFHQQAYKLLEKINENSKFKMTNRQLHDALATEYVGIVERTTPLNKVHYRFGFEEMQQHLRNKGWWVEY